MNDNYQLVFTTGAPGSCWSMISNRLKRILKDFDKSDETTDRKYKMPEEHVRSNYEIRHQSWAQSTHSGMYFGPYHSHGHGFDNIPQNYTREEFINECLKPFTDNENHRKLVRSHWFAYNLDWIWENFKGHRLFLIWREPQHAENWWYSMGGWDINYPIYKWYEGPTKMHEKIIEETDLIWKFAEKHNLEWWDYDTEGQWLYSRFPNARVLQTRAEPIIKDTIKVCYVKID